MRLLVIEDQELVGGQLQRTLEEKGFSVDWVRDGKEAHEEIHAHHEDYAVVILDLSLPSMSGLELLKNMRDSEIPSEVLVLTGRGSNLSKVELLNAGADDYLVKPFASEELIARINALCRRPHMVQKIIRSLGDVTIDTTTRIVMCRGREIFLTTKEYALLECLLRRPGEVFTREELSGQMWDFDVITFSNILDVHIKNLRRKLYQSSDSIRFETVRGIGYRLVKA